MGCFSVEQRTKDGMFNATALLKQWNESAGEKKEIKKFFENQNTKEFISALIEEGFITKFDDMMEYLRNQWRKVNVPRVFQKSIQQ